MAVTLIAFAVFLGWLAWAEDDGNMAGLFGFGAMVAFVCAVIWFLGARKDRRRRARDEVV